MRRVQLSRTLTDRRPQQQPETERGSAKQEAYVVTGPPVETINITLAGGIDLRTDRRGP